MYKQYPGSPLVYFGEPYNLEEHLRRVRLGLKSNMLRTGKCAHPRALKAGDVLATGQRVLSISREAGKDCVFIHITGHEEDWPKVSECLPLAFLEEENYLSQVLLQTFETSCK